ncbi:hypothetical protein [Sporosarcina obsidiansis]|uniref:hypothetical protein n=1 Tax=Sporosarcina obsidiansis TaxID=2660748 RepID=UPI00129C0193|nr:hypothetical protein [Sporosarcina obsidiansis]
MVEDLSCEESRIWILGKPVICNFCEHDVFTPFETYKNVEEPGIEVYFVNYTAVCMRCGCATQFNDPSHPSADGTDYIWAFDQTLLHPPEPEPPVVRIVDPETLQAQKTCLHLALQILVKEGKVGDTVLSLAKEMQYEQVVSLIRPNTQQPEEEITPVICLAIVLTELSSSYFIDGNRLYSIIEHESYPGVETFLREQLFEA